MVFKLIFGVLLAVALYLAFTAWLGFSRQEAPRTPTNQTNQETNPTEIERSTFHTTIKRGFIRQGDFIHDFREEIVAVGTLFIAAFTVILAFATGFLYFATRDLVTGADKNAEKQLRAYVGIWGGSVQWTTFPNGDSGFYINVDLRNSGQTPAYDFITWIRASISPVDVSPVTEVDWSYTSRSIVGPGTDSRMAIWVPATTDELVKVRDRTSRIFIWGKVEYRDAFDKRWRFVYSAWNGSDELSGPKWAISPKADGYLEIEIH
jgi:hypothetical protein